MKQLAFRLIVKVLLAVIAKLDGVREGARISGVGSLLDLGFGDPASSYEGKDTLRSVRKGTVHQSCQSLRFGGDCGNSVGGVRDCANEPRDGIIQRELCVALIGKGIVGLAVLFTVAIVDWA